MAVELRDGRPVLVREGGEGLRAEAARLALLAGPGVPEIVEVADDGLQVRLVTVVASPLACGPDEAILAGLEQKIAAAEAALAELAAAVADSEGAERLRRLHRYYVVDRERLELALSLLLNRRKLADGGARSHEYLYGYDEEIAAVGKALNHLRIKRRVFDYVVQALD